MTRTRDQITKGSPFAHECESCGLVPHSVVNEHRIQGGDWDEVLYEDRCSCCGSEVFDAPPTFHVQRRVRWIPRQAKPKPILRDAA